MISQVAADGEQTRRMEQWKMRLPVGLAAIAALARLIPHPPNFTPVGGMSLYAGARLAGWRAYLLPLVLMVSTDALLMLVYGYPMFRANTPFVYAGFLVNVLIGKVLLRKFSAARFGAAAALGSTQFFLLTNFAVWMWSAMYPPTLAGLAACYVAALPFFGRTLFGDLLYGGLLFGLDAWANRFASSRARHAAGVQQNAAA